MTTEHQFTICKTVTDADIRALKRAKALEAKKDTVPYKLSNTLTVYIPRAKLEDKEYLRSLYRKYKPSFSNLEIPDWLLQD